ncbi:MAG: hypothetical protein WCP12_05985 [bacterium]
MQQSIMLFSFLLAVFTAQAKDDALIRDNTTPAMICFAAPIQFPSSDWSVSGIRIGLLYSNCDAMTGLDFGFINKSRETRALQIGFTNIAEGMSGLQIGIINYADRAAGIQIGLVNIIADSGAPFLPLFNASF